MSPIGRDIEKIQLPPLPVDIFVALIPTVLLTKEQAYLLINHAMWCNTLIERTRGVS